MTRFAKSNPVILGDFDIFFNNDLIFVSSLLMIAFIAPSLRRATNVIDVKNSFDKEENLNHKKIIKDVIENIRS